MGLVHWRSGAGFSNSAVYSVLQPHGAEYLFIADAIYHGDGFVNCFGNATGPTGWVSPLLAYLMAGGLVLVGGDHESLAALFLGM